MKKILIAVLVVFIFAYPALAQTATDSSLTDKIKERLEKTAEEGIDKIKDEVVAKVSTPQKKAYIGTVKTVTDATITVEYKSQVYSITTADATDVVKGPVEPDDYIIALGFVEPNQTELQAKKITVIDQPQPPANRQLLTGQVEEVDGNKVTIDSKSLTISSKTVFKIKDTDKPTVEDIQIKDYLFAIVVIDKNGDISEVKNVLVLPGKNNPAASAPTNATESGQATESATIE